MCHFNSIKIMVDVSKYESQARSAMFGLDSFDFTGVKCFEEITRFLGRLERKCVNSLSF